jgi:hypothetical protein
VKPVHIPGTTIVNPVVVDPGLVNNPPPVKAAEAFFTVPPMCIEDPIPAVLAPIEYSVYMPSAIAISGAKSISAVTNVVKSFVPEPIEVPVVGVPPVEPPCLVTTKSSISKMPQVASTRCDVLGPVQVPATGHVPVITPDIKRVFATVCVNKAQTTAVI